MNIIYLSICIPAYNGEKYIAETLDSIIGQGVGGIEILVTDDSNKSETGNIVKDYRKKFPTIVRYIKNKKTLGFDKNVLNVVNKANGKFCWLLGQDDKLLPGSLRTVTDVINKNPKASLIYSNYTRYDDILKKITARRMINLMQDKIFRNADDFYFKIIKNSYFRYLGTNVITMSTDIVNRKLWLKYVDDYKVGMGHNFIHCYAISRMIKEYSFIVFLGKPHVWYRSNHHRIWPNNIWQDYNQKFIDYLIGLGYSKKKALSMRESQRIYEKTEAAIKHPVLKYVYPIAQPFIAYFRMVKERIIN